MVTDRSVWETNAVVRDCIAFMVEALMPYVRKRIGHEITSFLNPWVGSMYIASRDKGAYLTALAVIDDGMSRDEAMYMRANQIAPLPNIANDERRNAVMDELVRMETEILVRTWLLLLKGAVNDAGSVSSVELGDDLFPKALPTAHKHTMIVHSGINAAWTPSDAALEAFSEYARVSGERGLPAPVVSCLSA